jgi:Zn2+/Cd2+-exporting ATPase
MPDRNDPPHNHDDPGCVDILVDAVAEHPGIVGVTLDPEAEEVSFAYDPRVVDEHALAGVAAGIEPELRRNWSTCTMQINGGPRGRACETCALALEQRLAAIPGVRRATVSYRGGALAIHYDPATLTPAQLQEHIEELRVPRARPAAVPAGWRRWFRGDGLAVLFTAITLLAMLAGLLLEWLGQPDWVSWLAYGIAYVTGGYFGLRAGLASLRARTIDVDLLMVLAAIGAALVNAPFEGAMLLFLFSLSNVLQTYALDRTRNAIRALMALRPDEALVRRGDDLVTLPLDEIAIGDELVVKPGDRIPLDGRVLSGESGVDQSPITGESMPVHKGPGDTVLAGSIVKGGSLDIGVSRLASDSTIARLIRMVEEAHSEKAETQRFIDRAEQYYALGVILMTAGAIVIPTLLLGEAFDPAFYRAMTLMVAASPCALVISTPATVLSAIGNGARRGVLFKGGAYVEQAATIKVVAFDKTGTLTVGEPQVTDVIGQGMDEDELLALAAAVESRSEHPLAEAIVQAAERRGLDIPETRDFHSDTGRGVSASLDGHRVAVGNMRHFDDYEEGGFDAASLTVSRLQRQGKTAVVVAWVDEELRVAQVAGVIGIADVLRPDAPAVVKRLKEVGVERVVMLTGDHEEVAAAIAAEAGVDAFHAGLLPEDKLRILKEEEAAYGPVAMVGDGVNDAPALAAATIGMAMGAAGTDVALETADVVLMADDLTRIPYAIGLSRQTRRTLMQNLAFALGGIVILVGAVLGFGLALPLSVIGHEGSTVIVSLNGLRLLGYKEKSEL